ncbi:MAG: phosphomannomutase/phosphoglucomutase [Patescibacteria group bacterium]|jgi:phosphomannomutase|nr:phosphomannomutase/phosphoglucomutase [Patescibacteria group bacterium]
MNEEIFKAYDVRGVYPSEIDERAVGYISKAYVAVVKPKKVVIGRDVRTSGQSLLEATKQALTEAGTDVVDIGVITTDMLYFAVAHYGFDGGIGITASHNPSEYNGLKMVRSEARPVSMDSGLAEIRDLAAKNDFKKAERVGKIEELDILDGYIKKLLTFVDKELITNKKIVANPNFGAAGKAVERLASELNFEIVKLNFEENGKFPKGRPDPLLAENRKETTELIKKVGADFGVAWDADADRCFFFDETGAFVDGYYEAALLSQIVLDKYPGGKIIHDPRLIWATQDLVKEAGGIPLINKVGHSFIKERMRREEAVFGGENSGHFYFKDFYYCDNGMIPFLLMLQKLCETGKQMSELVNPLRQNYPVSGEINFTVTDSQKELDEIKEKYNDAMIDTIDGISVTYPDWRFNVRISNTEPLLRLNVEARTKDLVDQKVAELTAIIED